MHGTMQNEEPDKYCSISTMELTPRLQRGFGLYVQYAFGDAVSLNGLARRRRIVPHVRICLASTLQALIAKRLGHQRES